MGQFWAVLVRMEARRECSDKKSFHGVANGRRLVYYGSVFEAKT